jgi:hypothetical protein
VIVDNHLTRTSRSRAWNREGAKVAKETLETL